MKDKEKIHEFVRKNYAKVAVKGSGGGCCGGDCGCGCAPSDIQEVSKLIGYTEEDFSNVPSESNMGLGCGNPIAIAGIKEGETVLDLGSGGGFDCFLAVEKVGEKGTVIGVDMTPEMVELARKNAKESRLANIEFRLGEIEHLPVADNSVDVIISNCVINLSPNKEQVFKEAYRVLKPGGRLAMSDILAEVPIPEDMRQDLSLIASCISGAECTEQIKMIMEAAGFRDVRLIPKNNSKEIVKSWAPDKNVEDYISSYFIEAVK
jgi:arsenite methyltransferase